MKDFLLTIIVVPLVIIFNAFIIGFLGAMGLGLWSIPVGLVLLIFLITIFGRLKDKSDEKKWEEQQKQARQKWHMSQKLKAQKERHEKEKLENERLDKIRRENIKRINDDFEKANTKRQEDLAKEVEKRKAIQSGNFDTYDDNRCSNHNSNQLYKDVGGDGCDDVYLSDGVWISSDGDMHSGR